MLPAQSQPVHLATCVKVMQEATSTSTSSCGQRNGAKPSGVGMGCQGHPGSILGQSQVRGHLGHSHPLQGGDSWEVGKKANIQSYRVVSTTGHISHNHIWDWQNLPSFVFSMKMATHRGTSSQSYSIRCARAMNFPSELCPS